jgi:hypothetical protein
VPEHAQLAVAPVTPRVRVEVDAGAAAGSLEPLLGLLARLLPAAAPKAIIRDKEE